ncbi:MAG: hypothetical protein HQL59_09160 [Magnetococcales bacterium]|nr:hypothetical protein [Magnetococcales bacterium]
METAHPCPSRTPPLGVRPGHRRSVALLSLATVGIALGTGIALGENTVDSAPRPMGRVETGIEASPPAEFPSTIPGNDQAEGKPRTLRTVLRNVVETAFQGGPPLPVGLFSQMQAPPHHSPGGSPSMETEDPVRYQEAKRFLADRSRLALDQLKHEGSALLDDWAAGQTSLDWVTSSRNRSGGGPSLFSLLRQGSWSPFEGENVHFDWRWRPTRPGHINLTIQGGENDRGTKTDPWGRFHLTSDLSPSGSRLNLSWSLGAGQLTGTLESDDNGNSRTDLRFSYQLAPFTEAMVQHREGVSLVWVGFSRSF